MQSPPSDAVYRDLTATLYQIPLNRDPEAYDQRTRSLYASQGVGRSPTLEELTAVAGINEPVQS